MAKRVASDARERGEQLLRKWQAGSDADALRAVWGRDPDADAAIVARLGAHPEAGAAAVLVELDRTGPPKSVRKEIRRALFRLQQRGVPVPKPEAEPAPPLRPPAAPIEGYLSPSDGNGDQLLWLLKPQPGGLAHLFAVVNDPAGMHEADLAEVSRKSVRAMREDLRRQNEIDMVPVDAAYCDHRMALAHAWASARQAPVRGDYLRFRARLFSTPPREVPHPILAALGADAVGADPTALGEAAELLEEKEFRTWFLTEDAVRPYLEQIQQVSESPLLLSPQQQEERAAQVVDAAVAETFGGERQASTARRMLDMAWVFHATRRDAAARRALATALALRDGTRGGRGIPFCEALVRTSVAAHYRAAEVRKAEEARGSLIVTPQQARASLERQR